MTRYSTPSWLPTSKSVQMCGWVSAETAFASRSNLCRSSVFSERC